MRKNQRENLVPLNVMVTPNQKLMMESESEATGMSLALITRKALDDRYADRRNPTAAGADR